jgi:hypothetical protein
VDAAQSDHALVELAQRADVRNAEADLADGCAGRNQRSDLGSRARAAYPEVSV